MPMSLSCLGSKSAINFLLSIWIPIYLFILVINVVCERPAIINLRNFPIFLAIFGL